MLGLLGQDVGLETHEILVDQVVVVLHALIIDRNRNRLQSSPETEHRFYTPPNGISSPSRASGWSRRGLGHGGYDVAPGRPGTIVFKPPFPTFRT